MCPDVNHGSHSVFNESTSICLAQRLESQTVQEPKFTWSINRVFFFLYQNINAISNVT